MKITCTCIFIDLNTQERHQKTIIMVVLDLHMVQISRGTEKLVFYALKVHLSRNVLQILIDFHFPPNIRNICISIQTWKKSLCLNITFYFSYNSNNYQTWATLIKHWYEPNLFFYHILSLKVYFTILSQICLLENFINEKYFTLSTWFYDYWIFTTSWKVSNR